MTSEFLQSANVAKTTAVLAAGFAGLLAAFPATAAVTYDQLDKWIDKHAHCFACHDSREGMKSWLLEHEEESKKLSSLAPLIHAQHQRAGRSLGNCLMCHADGAQAHWKVDLDKNNCKVCHPIDTLASHAKFEKREDCQGCHKAKATGDAHTARFKKEAAENQRGLLQVAFNDARLVQKGDAWYADLVLAFADKDGKAITMTEGLDKVNWVDRFKLYVNFGADSGMTEGRAKVVTEKTAAEIRRDGTLRYEVGPFKLENVRAASDLGEAVVSMTYCFDDKTKLAACTDKSKNIRRNAAWNTKVFFSTTGIETLNRAEIVSNEKCGGCHGYVKTTDAKSKTEAVTDGTTQIACGGCHNQNTKAAKAAGTKHCSGTDGTAVTEKRTFGLPSVHAYTSDLTDVTSCGLCHNAKTAPTAVIRNKLVDPKDPHYVDELILAHPDMKVFAHAHHGNKRAGQLPAESIRHVTFIAHENNCTKCHQGQTYSLDRLAGLEKWGLRAEPLALDTKYNAESKAFPAIDFKADRYASPMAATCYSCHAKKDDGKGGFVWNEKAKQHIVDMGGVLGGTKDQVKSENCASCHTAENLQRVHQAGEIK